MRTLLILICLLALASLAFFLSTHIGFLVFGQDVRSKVKELYELANPGTKVEIVSVKEVSGMYKIFLKATNVQGVNYRELYVTKDGKLLTESVILVEESINQIKVMRDFVDCLSDKGVRIYGVLNSTQSPQGAIATSWQLNLLGRYSAKLYVSCDGNLAANCLNANVTQVPSVVFNGSVYPGIKTVDWFGSLTGCKVEK